MAVLKVKRVAGAEALPNNEPVDTFIIDTTNKVPYQGNPSGAPDRLAPREHFLGVFSSDPTKDMVAGDYYINNHGTPSVFKFYDGSAWITQ